MALLWFKVSIIIALSYVFAYQIRGQLHVTNVTAQKRDCRLTCAKKQKKNKKTHMVRLQEKMHSYIYKNIVRNPKKHT